MTTDTLPLAGSLLLATQHGPLVTVRIDGCEGEIVMSLDKWLALRATADVLRAADGEMARLREENANLREFIAASEECAKADDVLWYADENERMRAEFTRMMRQLETDGEVQFNASGCEWCGAAWPKPEGDTAEQVHERARRHVYRCAKHPMKIERDALSEQVASLRSTIDALKQECEKMRAVCREAALYCSPYGTDASDLDGAVEKWIGKPVDSLTYNDIDAINTAHVSRERAKEGSK